MSKTLTLQFEQFAETPGTIRYKEVQPEGERGKIGTIYLLKSAAEELGNPKKLTITISV